MKYVNRHSQHAASSTMDTEETPMKFRFLPAYRKHKRTRVALAETVNYSDHANNLSRNGRELLPAEEDEIVSHGDTLWSPSSPASASLTKPSVSKVPRPNRKRKCIQLCKNVAAFLLSTVGLTLMTIVYAVAGGYLFQALESRNEYRVKTDVKESLQWHIEALWNSTVQLNVLHPVNRRHRLLC